MKLREEILDLLSTEKLNPEEMRLVLGIDLKKSRM
jgi:hypothetical protein